MDHYVHGFRVNRPFSEHFRDETPSSRAFRHYASRHKTRILPCAFYRTRRILSSSRKPFSKTEMFFKRWIYKNSYLVVWLGLFPTRIIVPGKRFALDSSCMHSIFISRNEISRFIEFIGLSRYVYQTRATFVTNTTCWSRNCLSAFFIFGCKIYLME